MLNLTGNSFLPMPLSSEGRVEGDGYSAGHGEGGLVETWSEWGGGFLG